MNSNILYKTDTKDNGAKIGSAEMITRYAIGNNTPKLFTSTSILNVS